MVSTKKSMIFSSNRNPIPALHLVPAACSPAGAADGSLKVWDKRKLGPDGGSALFTFNHHTGAVLRAEWSPSAPGELHMPIH